MRNLLLAATAAAALLVTGCTPGAAPSTTAPPAPAESAAAPPAATSAAPSPDASSPAPSDTEPTETESTATQATGGCPDGRYALVKFSDRGARKLVATGDDLVPQFGGGQYVLFAPGRSAYTLTNGTQEVDMLIKGTIAGRYDGKGDGLTYTRGKVNGTVTLKAAGKSQSDSMESFAATLAPQGKVPTSCAGDRMTMKLPQALVEFERR